MTSRLILSACPVCVHVCCSWDAAKLRRQTRVYCTYGSGKTKGHSRLSLPVAWSRRNPPTYSITASKYFNSINQVVSSTSSTNHPANSWACFVELHINQHKPKGPEAMASVQHHLFFHGGGNVLSQAYQPPHRGSLTGFVWKEAEEGKEKCGENSDLKWQGLHWRSNPTETITVLKKHRSWIKTFLPSAKVAINLPSHSVSLSILTENPLTRNPSCPLTLRWNFSGIWWWLSICFLEDQEKKCTIVLVKFSIYPTSFNLVNKTWDIIVIFGFSSHTSSKS